MDDIAINEFVMSKISWIEKHKSNFILQDKQQAKRVWINLELAKKRPRCLEYIIVHEMVHLLERSHNARFYGYMDKFLPQWKSIKAELNGMIYK